MQAAASPNTATVPKDDAYIRLLARNTDDAFCIKVTKEMVAEFKTIAAKLNIPIPSVKKASKVDHFLAANPELKSLVELRKLQIATPRSKLVWSDTGLKTTASLQVNQKDSRGTVVAEISKVEDLDKKQVTSKWKELCAVVDPAPKLGR